MTKEVENKNLNIFLKKNGKKIMYMGFILYFVSKRKKHKVTLFMGPKSKNIKLYLDGPAK
jgi:hypothetical protein